MRVDYFGDDACHGQQIDVLPDRRAVNVFQNVGVFDFRPDISSYEIEHVLHPDQISAKFDSWFLALLAALTFAVATCFSPEILLMDEWIMAGDAAFVAKAQKRKTA